MTTDEYIRLHEYMKRCDDNTTEYYEDRISDLELKISEVNNKLDRLLDYVGANIDIEI